MFEREAQWVGKCLGGLTVEELGTVVNIGSSTYHFRTVKQPWIDRDNFAGLRARGVPVIHVDLKEDDGVDITADVMSEGGFARLRALEPRTALLCNILEHRRP